jgi:hypothetical protein
MKHFIILLLFTHHITLAQVTLEGAREKTVSKYHLGSYSYHEEFIGHRGYDAPLILTSDGGAAAFGSGDQGIMLVKLDKSGKEQWKKIIKGKGDESEPQSVAEDKAGNFYVFILTYDHTKYRGGCERVVVFNKTGTMVWDKYLGPFEQLNNPTVSYIRALEDGRILLRGHIVKEKPASGKDPTYKFWEGWIDKTGKVTEQIGENIDWSKTAEWKGRLKPE